MARDYKTIRQVADEWGVTVRRVQMLCNDGKIPGAIKYGKSWILPTDVERPFDKRSMKGRKRNGALSEKAKSEAINQMNQQFLLQMSYEIRTSLNTLMNFSDMIRTHKGEPKKVDEYIDNIQDAGRNILTLTNNAIEVARLEGGEVVLNESVCNVEAVLQKALDRACKEVSKTGITFERKADVRHEFIYADKEKLEQVLANVFEIALRFSRPGSNVKIETEEITSARGGNNMIRITLENQSFGISESIITRINDASIGELSVVKDTMPGFGLRTIIVKKLISLMKGSLSFESSLGFITKAVITLPFKIADFSEFREDSEMQIDFSLLEGKRVLLAEDNELNREMATEILEEAGFKVDCAEDGILCVAMLERAEADFYDFILMDIQMPNMNGLMATKVIRSLDDKKKSKIPVVAMTADVKETNKAEALEVGMNGFVEKPCDRTTLFSVLMNVMNNKND